MNISEKYNWKILFTGGIEDGESPYDTVRREVTEETGYKNIRSIEKLNFEHTDSFQRTHKGDNAEVEQTNMFVVLADGEQQERSKEEAELHKLEWHTREEMSRIIDRKNHKFIFDYAVNGDTSNFESVFIGFKKEDYFKNTTGLEWKEGIKEMQRNWIGKNEGIKYKLKVKDTDIEVETYSTHFEAFYADTFAVIAADHKMLEKLVKGVEDEIEILKNAKEIVDQKAKAGFRELEDHTGIFTGRYLVDPITGKDLPLWISSYALSDYGTGIIKCSAHDTRDFAFAKKYNLPLRVVMYPKDADEKTKKEIDNFEFCYNDFENAVLTLPTEFNGKNPKNAHTEILNYLVDKGYGEKSTQYKLKDWVFARQRYWGEPFPIVFDENHKSYVVADSELPVVLPDVKEYEPTGNGESPLANITEWVEVYGEINKDGEFVGKKNGKKFYRETNTMPQWAGSSWYWLRYMDPHNSERLVGSEEEKYWTSNGFPVDMYIGGMEHATRHLIYGRFWNQFLFDKGVISTPEPFKRLETVGLVLGKGGVKMSKRLGNVVNPDDVVKQFGADTLRLYIAFAGDFHDSFAWDEKSIVGPRRFIERVWAFQYKLSDDNDSSEIETVLHQTIKKVSLDLELLKFNTAIAQLMIFVNSIDKVQYISRKTYKTLIQMLSPLAPFVAEELWSRIGEIGSVHTSAWPEFDEAKAKEKNVNIAVQINGKLRDVFGVSVDTPDEEVISMAKKTDGYQKWVGQAEPKKIIVIKNKIVNVVL